MTLHLSEKAFPLALKAPTTAADSDTRLAPPNHKMNHDQTLVRSTDENSDEEFPSLSKVYTLHAESNKDEMFEAFWDKVRN